MQEITVLRKELGKDVIRSITRGYELAATAEYFPPEVGSQPPDNVNSDPSKYSFEHLGDNHAAMGELLKRLSNPELICVHEVHSRSKRRVSHTSDYTELPRALGRFIRAREGEPCATFIFGQIVDPKYVRAIRDAVNEVGGEKAAYVAEIECYRLKQSFPLGNFVILEYQRHTGLESEVLFGWGQGTIDSPGAVFASRHPGLVHEYYRFRDALFRSSEAISLQEA